MVQRARLATDSPQVKLGSPAPAPPADITVGPELSAVLARTGCLFVTSAVESVDDEVLAKLAKGHTRAELDERLADEIADVLCHALLLAAHHGVDLPTAIRRKWLERIQP